MGQEITRAIESNPFFVLCGNSANDATLSKADLIFDFSSVEGNYALLQFLHRDTSLSPAILIGTTGLGEDGKMEWHKLALERQSRILFAPNTSLGILLMAKTAMQMAPVLVGKNFDIEIVETHHRNKKDAPSGTALFLLNSILATDGRLKGLSRRQGAREADEIGVHSIRGGGVFGEHTIRLIGDHEELSFTHRAFSRSLFAQGALILGQWLLSKPFGVYELSDVDLKELG
jgi:4-hydroxy-tetrahydrodipicolinate reductase